MVPRISERYIYNRDSDGAQYKLDIDRIRMVPIIYIIEVQSLVELKDIYIIQVQSLVELKDILSFLSLAIANVNNLHLIVLRFQKRKSIFSFFFYLCYTKFRDSSIVGYFFIIIREGNGKGNGKGKEKEEEEETKRKRRGNERGRGKGEPHYKR